MSPLPNSKSINYATGDDRFLPHKNYNYLKNIETPAAKAKNLAQVQSQNRTIAKDSFTQTTSSPTSKLGFDEAENAVASAGRDAAEGTRLAKSQDAIAKANALGFGNSGALSNVLDEINTEAATSKAAAARDAKIGFSRERLEQERFEKDLDFRKSEAEKNRQERLDEREILKPNESKSLWDTMQMGSGVMGAEAKAPNAPKIQIIGGGAGDMIPLQGGGFAPAGNLPKGKKEARGNSSAPTF